MPEQVLTISSGAPTNYGLTCGRIGFRKPDDLLLPAGLGEILRAFVVTAQRQAGRIADAGRV